MTKLMQEILKDPSATWKLEADLPSGNRMSGTVGPMIGTCIQAAISFSMEPVSAEDQKLAKEVMDIALGKGADLALFSETLAELDRNLAKLRALMGGGNA